MLVELSLPQQLRSSVVQFLFEQGIPPQLHRHFRHSNATRILVQFLTVSPGCEHLEHHIALGMASFRSGLAVVLFVSLVAGIKAQYNFTGPELAQREQFPDGALQFDYPTVSFAEGVNGSLCAGPS